MLRARPTCPTLLRVGAHFISVDFNNAPEVDGSLMVMADQVRRAVAWAYKNATSFGGNFTDSISRAPPPARISRRLRSRPTGRRISACRLMS